MTTLSMMVIAWAICLLAFICLLLYRSHLERHEVSEVYLDENAEGDRATENDDLVRKVDQIAPYVKTVGGATALMTLICIGIYVAQLLPYMDFKH